MAHIAMCLRRASLKRSLSEHNFEKLKLSHQTRKLTSLSNAMADGKITPSEIASVGMNLFGDALDFMGYSNDSAMEIAQAQTDYYAAMYDNITQQQYFNNPQVANGAQLYFDETGALDVDKIYANFYEKALEEYAEEYIMPLLKEQEQELENKQTELEMLTASEEAELQQLEGAIQQRIKEDTIHLA